MRSYSFEGEPLFTKKQLVQLMVPLVVEQLLAVSVGIADTVMITSVGEAAVSGVSLVDMINSLVIYILSALATGGAIVVSQYIGRKDFNNASSSAKQLVYAVTILALAFGSLCFFLRGPILRLIYGSVAPDVMADSLTYLAITACSFPFLAIYNACAAIFRSTGNSRVSMRISLLMNLINIGGNAILIYGFGWGVAGAATATLASRAVSSLLIFALLASSRESVNISGIRRVKPDLKQIGTILRVGIPNGIENGMFHFGKLLVQSLLSGLGTASIAANAICTSIVNFMVIPGSAMGLGLITITGQCIGAKQYDQLKYYVKRLMFVIYAFLVIVCGLVMLFKTPLLSAFNLSGEALEVANYIFPVVMLIHITVWPYAFPFANVLRAAGDVRFTMIVSIISMWTLRIGMANLFIRYMGMGPEGIWYAMFIDWVLRSALFIIRYKKGTWMTKHVIASE